MADVTTIKVPKPLREAVMRSAREEGMTAAEFLQLVTDEHARRRRFEAVRSAYAASALDKDDIDEDYIDEDYSELTADWDQASNDGLA